MLYNYDWIRSPVCNTTLSVLYNNVQVLNIYKHLKTSSTMFRLDIVLYGAVCLSVFHSRFRELSPLYFSLFFGVCFLSSSLPPFSHSLYSSTPSLPLFQGIETTNLTLLNKLRLLTCNMHSLNHNVVTRWYISSAIAFLYIYITSYQMYQLIYV